jgi:hypothetical protein
MIITCQSIINTVKATAGLSAMTESRMAILLNKVIVELGDAIPETAMQSYAEILQYSLVADQDMYEFDRPFSQILGVFIHNSSLNKWVRLTATNVAALVKSNPQFIIGGPGSSESATNPGIPIQYYPVNSASGKTGICLYPRPSSSIVGTTSDHYNQIKVLVASPKNSVVDGAGDFAAGDPIPEVFHPGTILEMGLRYHCALEVRPQDAITYLKIYEMYIDRLRVKQATMSIDFSAKSNGNPRNS